ncbi:MAG: hypothetical protein IPH07_23560 [Deltaproteobacteria bacterium]|nr:hypothetical protein [Deltaproteobacteria bacterium]MBK8241761.1 hypothetical protein [Deltaproteobacteria bacterium]
MIGIDTETHLVSDEAPIPPIVCVSLWTPDPGGLVIKPERELLKELFDSGEHFVGQFLPYEMAGFAEHFDLMDEVLEAYEADRLHGVEVREKLLDIAHGQHFLLGGYNLKDLVLRRLKVDLDKSADTWRLRYAELEAVPLAEWPADAIEYAMLDAKYPYLLWEDQEQRRIIEGCDALEDEGRQMRAQFALYMMTRWGLRVDQDAVDAYDLSLEEAWQAARDRLRKHGIVRPDGSRDTKKAQAYAALKGLTRKTDTGKGLSLDGEACRDSGDPLLQDYSDYTSIQSTRSRFIYKLRTGRLRCRYDECIETGRTSASDPPIQQWPRAPGPRECIVPDEGDCLISVDVDKAECVAFAQNCIELFGYSELGATINADLDPYLRIASQETGLSYEECKARYESGDQEGFDARQRGKTAVLGFMGGMGPEKFSLFAKKSYNVNISVEDARILREIYRATYPEVVEYHDWVSDQLGEDGLGFLVHPGSNRLQGGAYFSEFANSLFQGRSADAMKDALWRVSRAQLAGHLPGRQLVLMHDELIGSAPLEHCDFVARETVRHVIEAHQKWFPDVRATSTPVAMMRWSKKAKHVTDKNGKLIPWDLTKKSPS